MSEPRETTTLTEKPMWSHRRDRQRERENEEETKPAKWRKCKLRVIKCEGDDINII